MKKQKSSDFELFKAEKEILNEALRNISAAAHQDNPLLPQYKQLATNYNKLLKLCGKLVSISDRQQFHLKQVEGDIKDLLDNAGQGFLTVGSNLKVDRVYSAECRNIFNTSVENSSILDLLYDPDNEKQNLLFIQVFRKVLQMGDSKAESCDLQVLPRKIKINGKWINIEYKLIKRYEKNIKPALMLVLSDISEKQAAEDKIHYLSYHDKLTGLYNRAYVDSILPELNSEPQLPTSLIIADMNGLKLSNDLFGHAAGDILLQNLARVFQQCCRQNDIIVRWGGDEFLIILPRTGKEACAAVCKRIKAYCRNCESEPLELSVALGSCTRQSLREDILDCFRLAENMMYHDKLFTGKDNRRRMIDGLKKKLWQMEDENERHAARIADLAVKMAEILGLPEGQKEELRHLAFMHDIGKLAVSKELLEKTTRLEENEWEDIKKHCDAGYRVARAINEPQLAEAILSHHEHYDGKGYPQGLKGEQIPLHARIISLADAYVAMTDDRSYRKAFDQEKAIGELIKCSGSQFDPGLVEVFRQLKA